MGDVMTDNDTPRGLAVAWRCGNVSGGWALRKTEPRGWARSEGLVPATDYAALLAEADALRERLRAVEGDAARWRYARRFLAGDDIEKWPEMLKGGHKPSEAGNLWADAAIDAAIGGGAGNG